MLGTQNVGKSTFIERIIHNQFNEDLYGSSSIVLYVKIKNSIFDIYLRDFWGQECFMSVRRDEVQKADGIILMYDITNNESFESSKYFYDDKIKSLCKKNIKKLLLGNKCDLKEKRVIIREQGLKFASENNYKFKEISCCTNENVFEAFEEFILDIYNDLLNKKN